MRLFMVWDTVYYRRGTVELFQQVKDELKQSGLIAEDEDGTIKLTSGDADNPG